MFSYIEQNIVKTLGCIISKNPHLYLNASTPPVLCQMCWEDVKTEMVKEKGLSEEAANQIGQYVSMQGKSTTVWVSCIWPHCGPFRGEIETSSVFFIWFLVHLKSEYII